MGDPGTGSAELFFMTDDLASEIEALRGKGVQCADVEEARWGSVTTLTMPSGATVGLYQPRHPSPLLPPP
jgi:hypothetical protein